MAGCLVMCQDGAVEELRLFTVTFLQRFTLTYVIFLQFF